MLYLRPFPRTDALTVNTNWKGLASKWTVRQLQYIVFTNPSARSRCDIRSIFYVDFNRFEFSFPSL